MGAHHSVGCVTGVIMPWALKSVQFCFQLFAICKGNGSLGLYTEWLGIVCRLDAEAFAFHCLDYLIKHCRELINEVL